MEEDDRKMNEGHGISEAIEHLNETREAIVREGLGGYEQFQDWEKERAEVLRDWDGNCQRCGKETKNPHIHHTFGLEFRAYEILCEGCHNNHHGGKIPERTAYDTSCRYCGGWIHICKYGPEKYSVTEFKRYDWRNEEVWGPHHCKNRPRKKKSEKGALP
jgi:hypothetical protein